MSKTCIKNNIFYKENIRYWVNYWILNYTFNQHGKFDFPQAQIVIINCTFMWICKFSHRDIFLNSLFIKRSSADKKLWLTDGRTDFCLQNAPNFQFMNFCCSFLALLFFKINFKESYRLDAIYHLFETVFVRRAWNVGGWWQTIPIKSLNKFKIGLPHWFFFII